MGRLLPAVIATLSLLILPVATSARDWADTIDRIQRSVVRVTHLVVWTDPQTGRTHRGSSVCAGSSINEIHSYYLTAFHCLDEGTGKDLKINGLPARLLLADKNSDLAVITADLHRPAVRASTRQLRKGEQVGTLGFAYGFIDSIFRTGYISHPSIDPYRHGEMGQILIIDNGYIGGQSGGPVFDLDGRIVGIVQSTDDVSGFGLNISTILHSTRFYWQFPS